MLNEAAAYIAQDSLLAAQKLILDALDKAESLTAMSERGRRVPELGALDIRELFVQRYRLIYEVRGSEVHILAFLHGARDFGKWNRETAYRLGI